MAKELREDIKSKIIHDFEKRIRKFDTIGQETCSRIEGTSGNVKTILMFIYAYLPLSDIAGYEFDMFLEYAEHGAFLYESSPYLEKMSDEHFLNYVVMPRINTEDLTNCRKIFYELVKDRIAGKKLIEAAIEINNWCYEQATYHSTSERTASPMTVYKCGYGRCGEESTFYSTVLRSVGIPCRQVYVPRWSHSDSNHAWVEVFDGRDWLFTGACEPKPIFQNGWFTYAASRAMVIHNRCFSPFVADGDEVISREGIVTINSSACNYSVQKDITVSIRDQEGNTVQGAKVLFEIINSSELFPIATAFTEADGKVSIKLGLGTIYIRAYINKNGNLLESEQVFEVSENSTAELTLILREAIKEAIWRNFTIHAPASNDVYGIELTPDLEKEQDSKNKIADKIRAEKHKLTDEQKEYLEKYKGNTQIERAIKMSFGNFDQIKLFLDQADDISKINRMIASLTQKDLRDVKASILLSHMQAFDMEKEFEERIGAHPDTINNILVDAENHADSNDTEAEFYHASNDFFAEYVASPRIFIERLTAFRDDIKNILGEENPFDDPEDIWNYIEKEISTDDEEEYESLITSPGALLKARCGSSLSKEVLFVAICRTYGIAAAIDRAYRKAIYFKDGSFVYAQKSLVATATLELLSEEDKLPPYFEKYTLCYRRSDGEDTTLESRELFDNTAKSVSIELIPGRYRVINCNRSASGSMEARVIDFDISDGQHRIIVLDEMKSKSDTLATYEVGIEGAEIGSPVLFLNPGQEPTEHVLNELIELHSIGKSFGRKLVIYVCDGNKEHQVTLERVRGFKDWDIVIRIDEEEILLKKIFGNELSSFKYPYVFYKSDAGKLGFMGNGYRVGIVDTLYGAVNQ
ncbi:MAG: transglutaminase domain-containing protein [Butyrivibrio sp.]|nr:transglutaminase domain-containing protein [Butyrivibrio sp.]